MDVLSMMSCIWILLLVLYCTQVESCTDCANYEDGSDLTVAEIVKLRGFTPEQHYLTTTDGYILSLVRILNPLINKGKMGSCDKKPILFVHGTSTTGAVFLGNSLKVKPRDYTKHEVTELDDSKFIKILEDDPVSKSLPFLASTFGHECWILTRRGSWGSLGHKKYTAYKGGVKIGDTGKQCFSFIGKPQETLRNIFKYYSRKSIDSRYWNYTLDQQANYDLPEVIQYILDVTESDQLAFVGHSSGAALAFMMLSNRPELSVKISTLIALSPTLYTANAKLFHKDLKSYALGKVLQNYFGPIDDSEYVTSQVECLINQTCKLEFGFKKCESSSKDLCLSSEKLIGNDPKIIPIVSSYSSPLSSRECLQIVQAHYRGKMHFFDHDSFGKGRIKHSNYEAPPYNVSQIKLKAISVFYGSSDTLALAQDVKALIKDLPASTTEEYFFSEGFCFSHYSSFYHLKVNTLINIPALRVISIN